MKKKVLLYSDELNDDFANNNIKTRRLPDGFRFIRAGFFYKAAAFFVYRLFATPFVFLYVKIKYRVRIKNRKILRQARKDGYFLFGNHTNGDLDAFVPSLLTFPQKAYIIVNPDATSIKGIRTLVMMLGGLPLPDNVRQYKRFLDAVTRRVSDGSVVTVYPEAHIWPYYTDIRDFNPSSLGYAVLTGKPVFCFTNTYVKTKVFRRPRVNTYVDGPFYPDATLGRKENVAILKRQVYETMKQRARQNPPYEYKYTYVKAVPDADPEKAGPEPTSDRSATP